jgi:hypothetical protein
VHGPESLGVLIRLWGPRRNLGTQVPKVKSLESTKMKLQFQLFVENLHKNWLFKIKYLKLRSDMKNQGETLK